MSRLLVVAATLAIFATVRSQVILTFDGRHSVPDPVLEQAMVWWPGR